MCGRRLQAMWVAWVVWCGVMWGQGKDGVTVEHVLKHQAGLQDFSRGCTGGPMLRLTCGAVKGVALSAAGDWDALVGLVGKAGGSGVGPSAYHDLAFAPLVGGIVQFVGWVGWLCV